MECIDCESENTTLVETDNEGNERWRCSDCGTSFWEEPFEDEDCL